MRLFILLFLAFSTVGFGQTVSRSVVYDVTGGRSQKLIVAIEGQPYSFTQFIVEASRMTGKSIPLGARIVGFHFMNTEGDHPSVSGNYNTIKAYLAHVPFSSYSSSADIVTRAASTLIHDGAFNYSDGVSGNPTPEGFYFVNTASPFIWNGLDNMVLSIVDTDADLNYAGLVNSNIGQGFRCIYNYNNGSPSAAKLALSAAPGGGLPSFSENSATLVTDYPYHIVSYSPPNTYNGTAWSYGSVSDGDFLTVNSDITLCDDATYAGMSVATGVTVTICSTATVTFTGFIKNEGTIFVENGGGLIQTGGWDDNSGSGTWTAKRSFTAWDHNRFNYWSSPAVGESMADVFFHNNGVTNSQDWYKFDVSTQDWAQISDPNEIMPAGVGYIATPTFQNPWTGNPINETREFSGTAFNTGTISTNYINNANDHILVGNPYPAPLDANDFLAANSADLYGTLYFWDDYGAYSNRGYAAKTQAGYTTAHPSGRIPDKINAMQGFFVQAFVASANVTFSPDMLYGSNTGTENNNFFKQGSLERIWVSASNDSLGYNQILVGMHNDATNGYDQMMDGKIFKANPQMAFYSVAGSDELAIQILPRDEAVERIELGLDVIMPGTYTFHIDSTDQWDLSYPVIFEDALTGYQTDLRNGDAQVTISTPDNYRERFYLNLHGSAVGVDEDANEDVAVRGLFSDGKIVFEAGSPIQSVVVLNTAGQVLMRVNDGKQSVLEISAGDYASGVYPAVVTLKNGQSSSLKILIP